MSIQTMMEVLPNSQTFSKRDINKLYERARFLALKLNNPLFLSKTILTFANVAIKGKDFVGAENLLLEQIAIAREKQLWNDLQIGLGSLCRLYLSNTLKESEKGLLAVNEQIDICQEHQLLRGLQRGYFSKAILLMRLKR